MKKATITAAAAGERALAWSWRSSSDDATSDQSFAYYYECLIDAREHGYSVDPVYASGATAPGGAAYSLDGNKS